MNDLRRLSVHGPSLHFLINTQSTPHTFLPPLIHIMVNPIEHAAGDADERGNEEGRNEDVELVDDVKSMGVGADLSNIMSQLADMGGSDSGGESDEDDNEQVLFEDDEEHVLDEQTLHLIKCNDPNIKSLVVNWDEDEFACSVDWENEGDCCIGEKNMHVKKLSITGCYPGEWEVESSTRKYFEAFCKGLAHNRSIEHLEIDDCELNNGIVLSILSPLFEGNTNLRRLDISSCTMNADCCTHMLASALSTCNNSSLEEIGFDCNEIDDGPAGELIAALNTHRNLVKLSLLGNNLERNGCVSLGNLLKNPTSKLKELYLNRNSIDDECVTILENALANNTTLEKLDLSNNHSITATGWRTLSTSGSKVKVVGAK